MYEYKNIYESDPHKLEQHVDKKCKEGWMPHGNMSVVMDKEEHFYFFQPMTRAIQGNTE